MKGIFNPLMIWGAVLGWFILAYAANLIDTIEHKGPGIVHYGDNDRGPEWSEEFSESEYKRGNYVENGFMRILAGAGSAES